jgi:hypothetical protein
MIEIRRRRPRRAVRRVWDGRDTDTGHWLGWEFTRRPVAVQRAAGLNRSRTPALRRELSCPNVRG